MGMCRACASDSMLRLPWVLWSSVLSLVLSPCVFATTTATPELRGIPGDGKSAMPTASPSSANTSTTAVPKLRGSSGDGKAGAPAVPQMPVWCSLVPEGRHTAECTVGSCKCEAFCESEIRHNLWKFVPQCCGCAAATSGGQDAPSQNLPAWCHFWPEALRDIACGGHLVLPCSCESFCARDYPLISWKFIPHCCSCPVQSSSFSSEP